MTLQGLSLGSRAPCPSISPSHRLQLGSHDGQCPHISLCVVAVVIPWQPRGVLRAGSLANRRASQPTKSTPELRSFASQWEVSNRHPFSSYHQEAVLTLSWNSCSRRRLSPFHSTHSAMLHPEDMCVSLSWLRWTLNLKKDVTLIDGCGILALFLKLSTCNKINSRNRRRGKPSSLQIKVPTQKTCNRVAVCCNGCSVC